MVIQKDLVPVFRKLKKMLKKYENPLKPKLDLDSKYDLWSFRDVTISGRKRKEVLFAGIIIQNSYVGFYFMPVYTDTDLKKVFGPDLLKLSRGKSCFHIRKLDRKLETQIGKALETGYALYKKRGWI